MDNVSRHSVYLSDLNTGLEIENYISERSDSIYMNCQSEPAPRIVHTSYEVQNFEAYVLYIIDCSDSDWDSILKMMED